MLINNYIQRLSDADNQISAECKISLLVKFEDYLNVFLNEDTSKYYWNSVNINIVLN